MSWFAGLGGSRERFRPGLLRGAASAARTDSTSSSAALPGGPRRPEDRAARRAGARASGYCTDGTGGWGVASNEVAWNGSTFLVAMGCETSTGCSGSRPVERSRSPRRFPRSTRSRWRRPADHFLLVVLASDGDYGPIDIEAQARGPGRAVGRRALRPRPVRAPSSDLTVAASNGAYLAAWTVTGDDRYPDLVSRTVHPDGSLGGTRVLSDDPGPQVDPALVGGCRGLVVRRVDRSVRQLPGRLRHQGGGRRDRRRRGRASSRLAAAELLDRSGPDPRTLRHRVPHVDPRRVRRPPRCDPEARPPGRPVRVVLPRVAGTAGVRTAETWPVVATASS